MQCRDARDLISALADGEATPLEHRGAVAHARGCPACREFARAVGATLDDAATTPVQRRRGPSMPRRSSSPDGSDAQLRVFLRLAVATVGLAELARALPTILAHLAGNHAALSSNHLAAWDLAFAVGLLVVAAQPYRVRGMLPMAAAITAVMALSLGLDTLGGHAPEMAAGSHFLELCGLVLLWCLERVLYPTAHGFRLRLQARHRPAS